MFKGRLTNRFSYGKRFLHIWGVGVLHKNVSQILAIIDFFKERNYRKNRVRKEEYYRQHNFKPNKPFKFGQIWYRQLHSWLSALSVRFWTVPMRCAVTGEFEQSTRVLLDETKLFKSVTEQVLRIIFSNLQVLFTLRCVSFTNQRTWILMHAARDLKKGNHKLIFP